MLHRKTIAAPTLGLLKAITAIPELSAFNLAGGTSAKYEDGSTFMVSRSITYFDDADQDEDLMIFKKVAWEKIKETILKEVQKLYA